MSVKLLHSFGAFHLLIIPCVLLFSCIEQTALPSEELIFVDEEGQGGVSSSRTVPLDFGPPDEEINQGRHGDECTFNTDCISGHCIELRDGRQCTSLCNSNEDCPDDLTCGTLTNSGADITKLCILDDPDLCAICEDDSDCDDPEDRCLQIGRGKYCAEDCTNRPCPEGYECTDVDGDEGQSVRQCLSLIHI